MRKKPTTRFVAVGLAAAGLVLAGMSVRAEELTIGGVGGTPQAAGTKAFVEPFSKQTGIKITEDEYDQKLAEIRAQVEAKQLKWDVVMVGPAVGPVGCDEGLFEKIDAAGILKQQDYDKPLSPCLAPIFSSSGVLVYDGNRIKSGGPKTWADFWDVKKWPGKRGFYGAPNETLELALLADGVPPNKIAEVLSGPGGVDRAFKKLDELKPHIHWWTSASDALQLLASGELAMTYCWNGRVSKANRDDGRNFQIVWEAGHLNGSEFYAILKGTPNKEAATQFISYASSPEAQAEFAKIVPYGPLNKRANDLLPSDVRANLPSSYMKYAQDQDEKPYVDFWLNNMDSLNERFAAWQAQ